MGGGVKTYLAPPHIFEWGGGGPIPPPPVPTPLVAINKIYWLIIIKIKLFL